MSNENTPTYPENLTQEVTSMRKFLSGRAKTYKTTANLEHGYPLFGKPYSEGERTYTVQDVQNCVINMLDCCRSTTTDEPHKVLAATWFTGDEVNTEMKRAAYGLALAQTNRNGKLLVVAFANQGTKPFTPKLDAMRSFKLSQPGATVFTVKGMKGKFATYKNAVGAGVRKQHAKAWAAINSDNKNGVISDAVAQERRNALKAKVNILKDGKAYSKAPKSTSAPAATVEVSKTEAVAMAKALGATGKDVKTLKSARAFLASKGLNV
tara:strand:- start:85 stop:882 length:798 start_codon:yes stop_codon:yes gene_type:complete